MKYIFEEFKSIDELLRTINARQQSKIFEGKCSSRDADEKFAGTKSYDEAIELIKSGWDEPVKDLKSGVKALNIKTNVTQSKARPRNSVIGYAPCVPAAILGLPESMIATERVPSKVKAVTIVYGNNSHCGTKTKEFIEAGAAMLKIINDLELKGFRVRLVCEFYSAEKSSEGLVARVQLKDWREHTDIKKIAFPIAHASMLRRIGFKYIETQPQLTDRGWPSGYGTPIGSKGYRKQVGIYKKNGMLGESEYFISLQMANDCKCDTEKMMATAGMTL